MPVEEVPVVDAVSVVEVALWVPVDEVAVGFVTVV